MHTQTCTTRLTLTHTVHVCTYSTQHPSVLMWLLGLPVVPANIKYLGMVIRNVIVCVHALYNSADPDARHMILLFLPSYMYRCVAGVFPTQAAAEDYCDHHGNWHCAVVVQFWRDVWTAVARPANCRFVCQL